MSNICVFHQSLSFEGITSMNIIPCEFLILLGYWNSDVTFWTGAI